MSDEVLPPVDWQARVKAAADRIAGVNAGAWCPDCRRPDTLEEDEIVDLLGDMAREIDGLRRGTAHLIAMIRPEGSDQDG